jgi:hypothetical protein
MATKQRTSTKLAKRTTKRAAAGAAKASGVAKAPKAPSAAKAAAKAAPTNGGGRVRRVRMGRLDVEVHEPIEESPEKRAAGIRRAATRIKTTARLLPSDLRWER